MTGTSITIKKTVPDNDNVQFRDQEKSKLNKTIIATSDVHTLIDDKII